MSVPIWFAISLTLASIISQILVAFRHYHLEMQKNENDSSKRIYIPRYKVDFSPDGGKLTICLDDIRPSNFRKSNNNQLYALNFERVQFLPSAFQALSFYLSAYFSLEVGHRLGCFPPEDKTWETMRFACGFLVRCDNNGIGKPLNFA